MSKGNSGELVVRLPRMRLDYNRKTALELERRGKESRVLTIEGTGLELSWRRTEPFLRDFCMESADDLPRNLLALLKINGRAYIHSAEAAQLLLAALERSEFGDAGPDKAPLPRLADYMAALYSKGLGATPPPPPTTKKQAFVAIDRAYAIAKSQNADQAKNKAAERKAATARLEGLEGLQAAKAEERELRRQNKSKSTQSGAPAGTNKEGQMATAEKKGAKKAPAKKTAAPKKEAAKKAPAKKDGEKKGRGLGIGAFCQEQILAGKSNEEVSEAAQKKFGSSTSAASVAWYRNKLKNEGKLKG